MIPLDPAAILAYIRVGQELITGGIATVNNIRAGIQALAQLFHGRELTNEELNPILLAVHDDARSRAERREAEARGTIGVVGEPGVPGLPGQN